MKLIHPGVDKNVFKIKMTRATMLYLVNLTVTGLENREPLNAHLGLTIIQKPLSGQVLSLDTQCSKAAINVSFFNVFIEFMVDLANTKLMRNF